MYTLLIGASNCKDPTWYEARSSCYEKLEMYINAVEDLQSACDLKPYP